MATAESLVKSFATPESVVMKSDREGDTILHHIILHRTELYKTDDKLFESDLKLIISINPSVLAVKNYNQFTPLHLVIINNVLEYIPIMLSAIPEGTDISVLKEILTACTGSGRTPIHMLAEINHPFTYELAKKAPEVLSLRDNSMKTPSMCAEKSGHEDLAKSLDGLRAKFESERAPTPPSEETPPPRPPI